MLGKQLLKSSYKLEKPGPGISKVPYGGYVAESQPSQSRQISSAQCGLHK